MRLELEMNDLRNAFMEALVHQRRSVSGPPADSVTLEEEWGREETWRSDLILPAGESGNEAGRRRKVQYGADYGAGTAPSTSRVRESGVILAA